MKKPTKIFGSFSWVVNGDDVCTVARGVNYNADVLEELISKVEDLEKQIADMRGKAEKSCNTCKNNDDEFSGECYECLKGMFDHYEPEEVKTESEDI